MELHCDTCARQRIFEQPACTDHPRETCPDRACTGCGAAIVVAPVILLMDRRSRVFVKQRDNRRHGDQQRHDHRRHDRRHAA